MALWLTLDAKHAQELAHICMPPGFVFLFERECTRHQCIAVVRLTCISAAAVFAVYSVW